MVIEKSVDSETNRAVVFFSYSWDDKSHRKSIGSKLADRFGIRVRFDQDEDQNLPVPLIIKTIVEEADALIVLISKDSMTSRYVLEELVRCHERGVRFIPIYLAQVDRRLIPEFLADIPAIRYDPRGEPDICVEEIKKRLEKIESRHLWKRRMLRQLHQTAVAIGSVDEKPGFIRQIAQAVVGTVGEEMRQLVNERYQRDISIEQNYVHRALPLFSQATQSMAVSIAGVSTFWVDPSTRPAAIRYAACHAGREAYRLFVFRTPRELNYYKNVLSVNSDFYGNEGGVFVCSFESYVTLFKQPLIGFLRVSFESDFGLLNVAIKNGENAWVKAELDNDNFRFEFVAPTNNHRVEELLKQFKTWRDLRPGDVHQRDLVLRWDNTFSTDPQRLASAMESVFPKRDRSVCHLVLVSKTEQQVADEVIWPLRHQAAEFEGVNPQSSWTGVRVSDAELVASHGNSNLPLKRSSQFEYLLKVSFDSSKKLQDYYRDTYHRDLRRKLYEGIVPETRNLFKQLDAVSATADGANDSERIRMWHEIEELVSHKLTRVDFKDEEPFSILVLEPGFHFGDTT